MQTRKFVVNNVSQAIQVVKKEMGADAIILSMRTVRQPNGPFGTRQVLEVTASLDRPAANPEKSLHAAVDNNASPADEAREVELSLADVMREMGVLRRRLEIMEETLAENSLEQKLSQVATNIDELQHSMREVLLAQDRREQSDEMLYNGDLGRLVHDLRLSGVGDDLVRDLLKDTMQRLGKRSLSPDIYGVDYLAQSVMDHVRIAAPFKPGHEQQIHMIVGPTGVGKTTTIAKLAAQQVFGLGRSAAFLTVDTFRVGAIDQLRTYARILDVPLEVCLSDVEVVETVHRYADKDVLFIDTAGSSQKDAAMIGELAKVYRAGVPMNVHLIVSAATDSRNLHEIAERYGVMPLTSLIVSKLDEATRFGSVYNLMHDARLPYSCFTVGQNVPDDIEDATPERVADLLLSIAAK
ncbi:MAG TPA: flagellar biosynthesis protein FlhF [bacterium]|nr:flagellar biosynthesis protein FlhF [bacterium]